MQKVHLVRQWKSDKSTGGVVFGPSGMRLFSLELPWKENQFRISCIPEGNYTCVWHLSPKFGWTYLVTGTAPRTQILFHAGNYPKDTWGCILLGKSRSKDRVWNSRLACQEFYMALRREKFELKISSV